MSRSLNFPVKGNHKIDKDFCYEEGIFLFIDIQIVWIFQTYASLILQLGGWDAVFCWQVLPRLLRGDCEAHVSIQRTQEDQGNPASFVWL